eukprot:443858-Rhodomonas_salina.1
MLVVRSKSGPDACFALPSRPGHEDSRCHRRVPSWFQLRKTMMVPLCSDYQLMFWISANNDVDLQKHCCSFTHTLESPRVRSRFFEGKQRTTLGKTVVELPVLRLSTTVNCLSEAPASTMDQRRRRNWWYLIGAGAAAAGAAYLLYQQYEREYQKAKRELDAGRVAVGKPVAQPRASPEPTPEPTLEPTPERPPAEPANRRNRPHVEDSGSADNARDAIDYAERRIQEEAAVREEENGTAGGADTACAQEA